MRALIVPAIIAAVVSIIWSAIFSFQSKGEWIPPEKPWQKNLRKGLAIYTVGFFILLGLAFAYVIVSGIISTA